MMRVLLEGPPTFSGKCLAERAPAEAFEGLQKDLIYRSYVMIESLCILQLYFQNRQVYKELVNFVFSAHYLIEK